MVRFNEGDEVSYVANTGKTIVCIVDGGGDDEVQVHKKGEPNKMRLIATSRLTLIQAAPLPAWMTKQRSATPATKTFRWLCLDCGNKYNGRSCPVCGADSSERVLNADSDLDPSIVLGGASAEPYTPRDDA